MPESSEEISTAAHTEAVRRIREAEANRATALDLSGLPLAKLPDELGTSTHCLENLATLNLSRCNSLANIDGLQGLGNLTTLDLSGCEGLTNIDVLEDLGNLTTLDLSGCEDLANVDLLKGLGNLTTLDLSWRKGLTNIHMLQNLGKLTALNLSGCHGLTNLDALQGLRKLTSLNLSGCYLLTKLDALQGLRKLTALNLSGCNGLTNLDGLQNLGKLKSLDLSWSNSVTNINGLQGLRNLARLDLSQCNGLTNIDGLKNLGNLTTLDLSWCEGLTNIDGLQGLRKLTTLDLYRCEGLTNIDRLQGLRELTTLNLSECNGLTNIDVLQVLRNLTTLDVSWCKGLANIDGVHGLRNLTTLDVSWCKGLTNINGLEGLANLTTLDLSGCNGLTNIDVLQNLGKLTTLNLSGCDGLTSIDALQNLGRLTALILSGCNGLTNIDGLKKLGNLTTLNLFRCYGLININGLEGLGNLTTLNMSRCHGLTNIDVLQNLGKLTSLNLSECYGLTNINGVGGLGNLTTLDLSLCIGLKNFSPVVRLLDQLNTLKVYGSRFSDLHPAVCGKNQNENAVETVRQYYGALGPSAQPDAEIKAFVLGNGRAGKTKLVGRLLGRPYEEISDVTTHGVQIESFSVPLEWNLPHPVTLCLWDFGGQDIYHGTHALFLREPAVYFVVFAEATENEAIVEDSGFFMHNRLLPYWFDYLRQAAGRDGVVHSPVLLVQAQCDVSSEFPEPESRPSAKQFPQLSRLVHTSAKDPRGLRHLLPSIEDAIKRLLAAHPQPPLPATWAAVRAAIREMQLARTPRALTKPEFQMLCLEKGVAPQAIDILRDALHLMGVIFYRAGIFGDQIIVDQSWVLSEIYVVNTRNESFQRQLKRQQGRFSREDLARYFWETPTRKHSVEDQELFLSFMVQCGICFIANEYLYEQPTEYISPDLLESWEEQPLGNIWDFQAKQGEEVTVAYRLLHDGIARGFLSAIGRLAMDIPTYWKYGCHFWEATTNCEVLIRKRDNTLSIQAWGEQPKKLIKALLEVLAEVPAGEAPTIKWKNGTKRRRLKKSVDCSEPKPVTLEATYPPKSVFFSYRHPNESIAGSERGRLLLRELESLLEPTGWKILFDERDLAEGDSISNFIDQVRACSFLVPVFCDRYLDSLYTLSELFTFRDKFSHDAKAFADRTMAVVFPESRLRDDLEHARCVVKSRTMFSEHLDLAGKGALAPRVYDKVYYLKSWSERLSEILESLNDRLSTPTAQQVAERLNRTYERLYPGK